MARTRWLRRAVVASAAIACLVPLAACTLFESGTGQQQGVPEDYVPPVVPGRITTWEVDGVDAMPADGTVECTKWFEQDEGIDVEAGVEGNRLEARLDGDAAPQSVTFTYAPPSGDPGRFHWEAGMPDAPDVQFSSQQLRVEGSLVDDATGASVEVTLSVGCPPIPS